MPLIRKRRATQPEPPTNDDSDASSDAPANTNTNTANNRRRRTENDDNSSRDVSDDDNDDDPTTATGIQAPDGTDAQVKKMVRLALASEYSRQPIKRKDISTKVLGEGSRQFKIVFEQAQKELRYRFGMEMREQPARAGLGGVSRGGATQRQSQSTTTTTTSTSNKSWILTTTLPAPYRTPAIIPPPRAPSTSTEATYIGLYSFIISLITLSGGSIAEQRLERFLARTYADTYTPIDRTDSLLARMVKEGYLIKHRETDAGEEVVEYYVGARGKLEVGDGGVEGLVRKVYGFEERMEGDGENGGDGTQREEFEAKLKRSLGLKELAGSRRDENGASGSAAAGPSGSGGGGRRGRRRQADGDEDMED